MGEAGSTTSAGSRASAGTTSSLIRSAPGGTAAKRRHVRIFISHESISAFRSGSAINEPTVCTKRVTSSPTNWLKALLWWETCRERQMVTKEHTDHQKALHRAVDNDWGLYGFVQMLAYKCVQAGKTLEYVDGARAPSGAVGAGNCSPCRCGSGPIAARTVGWSWTATRTVRSIITSGSLPGSRPHTGDPVRCAAVFTATPQRGSTLRTAVYVTSKQHVPVPCRLAVLLARDVPRAVILRRGPTRRVQLLLWHTDTDMFEAGQWFYGRIYEQACDLSPDGSLFLYVAQKAKTPEREESRTTHKWTALSRPPYFTALALWPSGNTGQGGGIFLSDRSLWLNYDRSSVKERSYKDIAIEVGDR